jgi:hypothetical protein
MLHKVLIISTIVIIYCKVHAQDQLTIRTGMLNGSVGGPPAAVDTFSIAPGIDVEYEAFPSTSNSSSNFFRFTLANDLATAQSRYFFAGYGHKYYLNDFAYRLDASNKDMSLFIERPLRYYFDWRVGVSSLQGRVATASLSVNTMAIDLGLGGGLKYQFTSSISFDSYLGMAYAYGFSSVSLTAMLMQILFGITYSY